jgi:selenide,water dikinase
VESQVRLSNMAHGGGSGCKLSPAVLSALLAETPKAQPFEQLLVGTETGDDAAVWQLDERTCLIATTDFFTPMVDDPGTSDASRRRMQFLMSTQWAGPPSLR